MTMEEKIKEALQAGPKTNMQLRVELEVRGGEDRAFDRTLQRMRKKGEIKVMDRRRWVLANVKVCPHCGGKGWVKG
jgi:hypothetical protein